MARIWVIVTSPSTSTGTCPRGLIARYSGESCSFLCSLTSTGSNGSPLASSRVCGTNEQAPGAKYSLRVMRFSLESSAAGPQRLAGQRRPQLVQPPAHRLVDRRQREPLAAHLGPLLHHP